MLGTVVVLGGSFGGVIAAAVAARHASRVILVERDSLEERATARKGVPQARHNHNLFARGREIVDRYLPGFDDELRARGAGVVDSGVGARWVIRGHRLAKVETGHHGAFASRPCIDAAMLRRLREVENVEIRDRTDVLGVVADSRVRGVRTSPRTEESGEQVIDCDLVIDATGRGSRTPAWLEALGRAAPGTDELETRTAYATRTFRHRPGDLDGDRAIVVSGTSPDRPRGGVAFAVEGDRWMVLLFGYGGAKPPLELEEFRAYAASLGAADLAEIVSRAEPLDDGAAFTYPRAVRRRYDGVRMPEGWLVFGDALVSTNPSWGAGMTSAGLQAEALDRILRDGELGRWHAAAIAATREIWEGTTGNDRAYACVEGEPSLFERVIGRYVDALATAAERDPVLSRAMIAVVDRTAPMPSILHPRLALRVLRAQLRPAPAASRMLEA